MPEDDYRMIEDLGFVITGPGPETKKGRESGIENHESDKNKEPQMNTDAHR